MRLEDDPPARAGGRVRWASVALALSAFGCPGPLLSPGESPSGGDTSPGSPNPPGSPGGGAVPVAQGDDRLTPRVWRLSPLHYRAEVERLFPGAPRAEIPVSAPEDGLSDIAANARINTGNVGIFAEAARAVARFVTDNGASMTRCANYGSLACAESFLAWFPPAAFRRALSAEENTRLRQLFDELETDVDFDFAVSGVVRAVLLSPQFLYRTELPAAGATLSNQEIAVLMAFGLTDRAPDAELLEAAANGTLTDDAERGRQAQRLMQDSAPMWQRFFWEWLHMSTLESQGQEVGLDASLVRQILEEYQSFIENIIVRDRGTLRGLLTSTRTWVEPELAALYGASHPGSGRAEVDLDATQRSGLLTLGAWLVSHGKRGRANVVRRGMGIYVDAMCTPIRPPEGLDLVAETERLAGPDATVQEIVEARGESESCGGCHRIADPVGLAFERYASTGAWQEVYADGAPVESAVSIDGYGDFESAVGLSRALAEDERFQRCMVQRLQHFLLGAKLPGRQRWTEEALATFRSADTSFEALVVDLISDPAFIERR